MSDGGTASVKWTRSEALVHTGATVQNSPITGDWSYELVPIELQTA